MTSYHGGKQKIGKKISEEIFTITATLEREYDIDFKGYCEPFCGMLGVYQHIPACFEDHNPEMKYLAGDVNTSVIKMWQAAQQGWKPPIKCSEKYFYTLKYDGKSSAIKGYIGHQYAFGGQYFTGFTTKYGKSPIQKKAALKVSKIAETLYDVKFSSGNYKQFSRLKNYIIYCDPPYQNTTCNYLDEDMHVKTFDHDKFWQWVRKMSKHNLVLVSEATAPKDFESLWTKKTGSTCKGKNSYNKEKLFIYKDIF